MTSANYLGSKSMYEISDVLSIPYGLYRHFMILIGPDLVVHGSKEKGIVCLDRLSDIAGDRPITNHGKWTTLPDHIVVQNAHELVGEPYRLFSKNCEHIVREISGVRSVSPQISTYLVCGILVGIFMLTRRQTA